MKILPITRFGNPILRQKARRLSLGEIQSAEIQDLINNIRYTNKVKEYGVGLAAPQVGVGVALSIIGIKPTPTRPNLAVFDQVIINPEYEGEGDPIGMWEGCQSCGSDNDILYAQAMRYDQVYARWIDVNGDKHEETITGFVAQVFQHETDHTNGILFVDRVSDTKTFMMADEFRSRIAKFLED